MSSHDAPYRSIAGALRAQIEAGFWKPGDALPGRTELMERFGVARATIDRAVRELIDRGFLESRQGSGTIVRVSRVVPRIAVVGSLLPSYEMPADMARLVGFGYDQIASASARRDLFGFDGVLWDRPEEKAMEWIGGLGKSVPQVLVNRVVDGFPCVSTDHRGAYRSIAGERLDAFPNGRPYFLRRSEGASLVSGYREAGFVDACRERQRFFESLSMPDDFESKLSVLQAGLRIVPDRPLIIFSDTLLHTGAVMAWVRSQALAWRRDVWYSDFDNDYPAFFWGVRVTSFIQDERMINASAISRLVALIDGVGDESPMLVFPRRREGDT